MAIPTAHIQNFETLKRACKNGQLALMQCVDVVTQKDVTAICAVHMDDDGLYVFTPLAKLFDGDPYEELQPPT